MKYSRLRLVIFIQYALDIVGGTVPEVSSASERAVHDAASEIAGIVEFAPHRYSTKLWIVAGQDAR